MFNPIGSDMSKEALLNSCFRMNDQKEFAETFSKRLSLVLANRSSVLSYDRADTSDMEDEGKRASAMDYLLDRDAMLGLPTALEVFDVRIIQSLADGLTGSLNMLPENELRNIIRSMFLRTIKGQLLVENIPGDNLFRIELIELYSDQEEAEEEGEGIKRHFEFAINPSSPTNWYLEFGDDTIERNFNYLHIGLPINQQTIQEIQSFIPKSEVVNTEEVETTGKLLVNKRTFLGMKVGCDFRRIIGQLDGEKGIEEALFLYAGGDEDMSEVYYPTSSEN